MVGGMKVVVGVGRKVEEGREHGVKGEMVETEEVKPESGTKEKVEGMDLGGMQDRLLRSQAVAGEPLLRENFCRLLDVHELHPSTSVLPLRLLYAQWMNPQPSVRLQDLLRIAPGPLTREFIVTSHLVTGTPIYEGFVSHGHTIFTLSNCVQGGET